MLYVSEKKPNLWKIVYPRKWQFLLNLETGEKIRIPNKPFPSDQDLNEKGIEPFIESLFSFYESKNENIKDNREASESQD